MPNSAAMSTYTTMMRVNTKGRPYAKDLYDLFSALLIQLPLTDHRSLFRTYPSTFTTDEAIESLGHLEFTHLVSNPNPLDPSNPLLTRTTTTFSMSKDMAKTLCQFFLNARLAESATDPQNRTVKDRGIWLPTPKGKCMIQDFSHRARVPIKHMLAQLSRIRAFPVVQFERLLDDDQISFARQNMIEAFKTMMEWLPTDHIMIDDIGGIDNDSVIKYNHVFFGYQCVEWIIEYTSAVSIEEALMIAAEFVQYGWILQVLDKADKQSSKKDASVLFKCDSRTQYYLTEKGRQILESISHQGFSLGGTSRKRMQSSGTSNTAATSNSSSGSSVKTTQSDPSHKKSSGSVKSKKEEYASRLLPNSSLSDNTLVIPKAVITKKKSSVANDAASEPSSKDMKANSSTDSTLHIENSLCDFGFSSASSTVSSAPTTICPSMPKLDLSMQDGPEEELDDHQSLQDRIQQLRINDTLNHNNDSNNAICSFMTDPQHKPNSQSARLQGILEDPLIRMYFRHFLKSCFCEENINFWVDYTALVKKLGYNVVSSNEGEDDDNDEQFLKLDVLSISSALCDSLLIHCCTIYNKYFCPENAPSELNIDHGLRYDIVQYMQSTFTSTTYSDDSDDAESKDDLSAARKKAVLADASNVPFGSISVSSHGILASTHLSSFRKKKQGSSRHGSVNGSMLLSIREGVQDSPQICLFNILQLYDQANSHICRIMAQDSVPRFIKTQKYKDLMDSYYNSNGERRSCIDVEEEEEEDYLDSDELSE